MVLDDTVHLSHIQPNNTDGDQDHQPGLLSQYAGIKRSVLSDEQNGIWKRTGGSVTGRLGPTPGLELIVYELPRVEPGELRGRHQQKMDPCHWHIPPALHPEALTGLGGVPDMIMRPIPHSVRGTQHQHRPNPEPAQLEGR